MKRFISPAALIIANLIPLYGVLFLGWDIFSILILYWAESGIIGAFTVIKILFMAFRSKSVALIVLSILMAGFFCLHFGGFMTVHLFFIIILSETAAVDVFDLSTLFPQAVAMGLVINGFLPLVISHGLSFFNNFIGKKEYNSTGTGDLIFGPYKRIMIMQATLILGGFAVMVVGQSTALVVLLIAIKIGVDLWSHIREHADKNLPSVV